MVEQAAAGRFRVLGCEVDALTLDEAAARVLARIDGGRESGEPLFVVTLGTEMVMRARSDAGFRRALSHASFACCDTVGLLLASRLRRGPLRERVTGVELAERLCAALAERGGSVYLLGGAPGVATVAAGALQQRYRGLSIAGTRDGFFAEEASATVAAEIRSSGADLLLAALGSPKQEVWLDAHLAASGASVGIGVGGALDVFAGTVARAPRFWQAAGLEWLYRLIQEPHRWRRQLALPLFVMYAGAETVTESFRRRTKRP